MVTMMSEKVSSPYKPDRDVDRQAFESTSGYDLKYHDIKTRRDAADARAKVGGCVYSVRSVVRGCRKSLQERKSKHDSDTS